MGRAMAGDHRGSGGVSTLSRGGGGDGSRRSGKRDSKARVWLIEPDGKARGGAGAVFRLYALGGEKRWLGWMYGAMPTCSPRWRKGGYAIVAARHREAAAVATRMLWGSVAERPRYRRMQAIFLRGLGDRLPGRVLVAGRAGGRADRQPGNPPGRRVPDRVGPALEKAYRQPPTLLRLDSLDRALHVLCWGGVVVSGWSSRGSFPAPAWPCSGWLSVADGGGATFLGYQWDVLLLEAGLLGDLFAPWNAWLGSGPLGAVDGGARLIRWLVFRVMFLSGVVKLNERRSDVAGMGALNTTTRRSPCRRGRAGTCTSRRHGSNRRRSFDVLGGAGRPVLRLRPAPGADGGVLGHRDAPTVDRATGNYGFFNLLTIVLCLTLVEDRDWGRHVRRVATPSPPGGGGTERPSAAAGAIIGAVTTMEGLDRAGSTIVYPEPLEVVRDGWPPCTA